MKDQFGDLVPDDLVTFSIVNVHDDDDIKIICAADWYEVDGILLVSAKAIRYLSESDPLDSGVDLKAYQTINYVAHILHRFNEVDGFYHA